MIGKFADVEENPTTHIISYLRENYSKDNISYNVLETSIEGVDEYCKQIVTQQENQRKNESRSTDETIIFIHLGVSSIATSFNLEECAYNTMKFRVPDERGNQPMDIPISKKHILESKVCTKLPLKYIILR